MSSNKQLRSDIMNIIDDNSRHISEGSYLELCNKLQKMNFCEDSPFIPESGPLHETIIEAFEDIYDEVSSKYVARIKELKKEIKELKKEASVKQLEKTSKYVVNPETGRKVLRDGRIGKKLAKQ